MKYFIIALLTLSVAGTTVADGHGDKAHDSDAYFDKMSENLDLTDDQAAQVKKLHMQYRADQKALREKHKADMSKVLNDEQMEKYQKMRKKHHHKAKKKGSE